MSSIRPLFDDPTTVDLRSDAPSPTMPPPPPEFVVSTPAPTATAPTTGQSVQDRLRRRRRLLVGAGVGLLALVLVQFVVVQVMYDQRQTHLAGVFAEGDGRVTVGEPLMILQIPEIGLNDVVIEGASASELRSGPGHLEGTAEPGEAGNIVISGRRSRYGGPFGELGSLGEGSQIVVKTRTGLVRAYEVEKVSRAGDSSERPVAVTDEERLTLVTSGSGVIPSRRVMVTATPTADAPEKVARSTPTPRGPAPTSDDLDQRSASPLGVALSILVLIGGIVALSAGLRELASRYGRTALLAAAVPAVALLSLMLIFTLDGVLPATL